MFKHGIKILQGRAVTQTVLGGLAIYLTVANFLLLNSKTVSKLSKKWLVAEQTSYCKNKQQGSLFWPTV